MKNKAIILLAILMTSCIPIIIHVKPVGAVADPARGLWHLDEGMGTTVYDSSGWNNDGTVYGGAVWTDGKFGKALEFDGVDDYVEVPDSASLDISGKITLEAWIYVHTVEPDYQVIIHKHRHVTGDRAYYLGLGYDKLVFYLSADGTTNIMLTGSISITTNVWTHVAATSDGTTMKLFVDGTQDSNTQTAPATIYTHDYPLVIGAYLVDVSGYERHFDGIIDEVKVSATTIWTVDDDRVQCPTADFTDIQDGIDAASSRDTIYVYDGTYNEALYINKTLNIKAASTPIIKGAQSVTTNYGARDAVIFVEDATDVVIEGFTIEGEGLGLATKDYGVIFEESNGTIKDCTVSPNTIGDMNSAAIGAWDESSLTVDSCTVKNFGRIGIFYFGGGAGGSGGAVYNSIIEGQVYSDPNYVNYGIEIEAYNYPCDIEIIDNEIYNCSNTHSSPSWSSAGIVIDGWLASFSTPSSTVNVSRNNIYDNYYGIEIVANPYSYAHYNNIYNNQEYGVVQDPDYASSNVTFDARFNWWSHASGPYHNVTNTSGLGDKITDFVHYSPWFGFITETSPMTYHVDPTGMIQDAIDDANPGDTILVHDGTYNESLYIDKSLTIKAASTPVIQGSQLFATDYGNREAVIFVENAEDVVLEDLDIEGEGLGPGPTKSYGVLYQNSSGAVQGCTVSPNTIGDMYSVGIAAISRSNLLIEDCVVENFGRIGVYATNVESLIIHENEIIGQVYDLDNLVNYGIEIEDYDGASSAEIVKNEIYNCDNTHPSPLWSSAAIIVDIWRAYYDLPLSTVSIEENEIHDNYEAIEIVSGNLSYAHYNNIYNNKYGVWNYPDLYGNNGTFDARFNWWGHETGPFHNSSWTYMGSPYGPHYGQGDNVGDYVLYDPWLECSWPAPPPTIRVEPSNVSLELINKTFSVNITINNLSVGWKAVAFEFRLTYNSTLLEVLDITEGPFLAQFNQTSTPPYTLFMTYIMDDPNYGPHVLVGLMIYPNATGDFPGQLPHGNGTIATITFKAIYQEKGYDITRGGYFKPSLTCNLTLIETLVVDPELKHISHNTEQGSYEILPNNIADLNWDGKVRVDDVLIAVAAFGSEPGHPRWNPDADVNGDIKIRVDDIYIIARNFGWTVDC